MHIRFEGAAGEVTGSRYHGQLRAGGRAQQFLVDCGMFQGRESDAKNLRPFGFEPREINFVVLTHAHIDHSGLLPRLCAQGFQGPIYCTQPTLELLTILLADSAHIQMSDRMRAESRKAKGKWRGELPEPLYSQNDVAQCIAQCKPVALGRAQSVAPGIDLTFVDSGHILGAASAILDIDEDQDTGATVRKRLVASGDIGTRNRPIMHDPTRVDHADVLIVESTYGDRLHRTLNDTEDELVDIVTSTMKRGGNVVMPAFAVGRTQEIIAILVDLVRQKRLPFINIFVDSPMASAASRITSHHMPMLDPHSQELYHWAQANPKALQIRFITEVEESKKLNLIKSGAIILSASGMCEAGRILHHLYWNLPRPQSSIVISGFQAAGTRGRLLVDKATSVRIMGEDVAVKASIHTLGGLSAHGDQADLLWWCEGFKAEPSHVFITHGESFASENFAATLTHQLGWKNITLPARGQLYPC